MLKKKKKKEIKENYGIYCMTGTNVVKYLKNEQILTEEGID